MMQLQSCLGVILPWRNEREKNPGQILQKFLRILLSPSGLSPSTSPVNTLGMREAVQDREKLKGAVTTQIRSGATELTQCLATQRSVSMQCSVVWPIFQYRAISRALCMKFSTCY